MAKNAYIKQQGFENACIISRHMSEKAAREMVYSLADLWLSSRAIRKGEALLTTLAGNCWEATVQARGGSGSSMEAHICPCPDMGCHRQSGHPANQQPTICKVLSKMTSACVVPPADFRQGRCVLLSFWGRPHLRSRDDTEREYSSFQKYMAGMPMELGQNYVCMLDNRGWCWLPHSSCTQQGWSSDDSSSNTSSVGIVYPSSSATDDLGLLSPCQSLLASRWL